MRPLLLLFIIASPIHGEDLIAKTEALSPEQERKAFKLPPGFEAQLVTSEPDIQKPMQIAFDAKNRLWVATSRLYPFPAENGKGTDKLFVLSDFDDRGKAKTVEVYDDKLNIPIGVLPLPDGSVIVSEVGRILKLSGEKKAEKREVLFDGFGTRDTHGMTNSFTLLPDGWVYACHGYLNDSKVKGKDGHEVHMQSGHTFRFRPDGSRIEIFTHGQVNPFGIAVDPWLNLYTADCHTKPMTQLIRGARYDSFGKPHDGLGYAPHMVHHQHGSTALCGLAYYHADHFPKEWQGVMFLGNVVTNRVNCDRVEWHGSTPAGKEMPDFLVSTDPWFRPVDIKLGPDGALYVSDFYNRIIGHYEVDLRHPQRDKDRGRIWRIVHTGKKAVSPHSNWSQLSEKDLLADFGHPNVTVRLLAANEAGRRGKFDPEGDNLFRDPETISYRAGLFAMVQERTGEITLDGYRAAVDAARKGDVDLKPAQYSGLVIKALTTRPAWGDDERAILLDAFKGIDSIRLIRAAIDGMTAHPHAVFVEPLMEYLPKIPNDDTHLRHAARVALKECVIAAGGVDKVAGLATGAKAATLFDVAVAIRTKASSEYLAKGIALDGVTREQRLAAAEVLGQFDAEQVLPVLNAVGADHDLAQALLRGLAAGGRKKLPGGVPAVLDKLIVNSFGATKNVPFVATLKLATDFPESAADFAARDCVNLSHQQLNNPKVAVNQRADLAEALYPLPSPAIRESLQRILDDANEPLFLRSRIVASLLNKPTPANRDQARNMLKTAPYALAVAIATGLANDATGAAMLFDAVKAGEAPARLLQERAVVNKLKAAKVKDLNTKIAALTKNLPTLEKRLDELVKTRATGFRDFKADVAKGKEVYAKQCAICHQLNNEGAKIGPQLDGVGLRGLERLIEDTIDPNRNVDQAFRAVKFDLKDGGSLTGLLLREEGAVYVVADALGKEQRLPKADVDEKTTLVQSAMPANLDTSIPEADYYHLLAYLLEQKQKK